MSFRWDDAKEAYLRERLQDDPQTPISHFEEYFGISYDAVRFKLKRMGIQIRSVRKGEVVIKPEVEDNPSPPEDVWKAYEQRNEQKIARHKAEGRYIAEFPNEVIAVSFISDQHIAGNHICDLKRMREDAELIANTPGLYACLGGDSIDNHIKHRAAILAARTTPGDQYELFDHYLSLFSDSILGVITGNHDDWSPQVAGVDVIASICQQHGIACSSDEARVTAKVGDTEYRLAWRHKYRFSSSMNQTHSPKQWYRFGPEPFDIGCVCHHHETAIEASLMHGKQVWVCRPGSYQINSAYGRQGGYNDSLPACPTFVLFPDTRRIIGFADVRDAVITLNAERKS
tara:strand:+ start:569 stop:1597 length:1029 start_codon:yes stop_codon:yes gene_type:complete